MFQRGIPLDPIVCWQEQSVLCCLPLDRLLGQRYPAGYPVGVVRHIAHIAGQRFTEVNVQPSAHINRSQQVLLVWPPKKS